MAEFRRWGIRRQIPVEFELALTRQPTDTADAAYSVTTTVNLGLLAADKAVNDRDGHEAGDQLLIDSARAWQGCLRPTDMLVRYGGDESVAVLPGCDAGSAGAIAARLHAAVPASCSLVVATWQRGEDQDTVLRRAEHNLYQSKRGGGDQITTDDLRS